MRVFNQDKTQELITYDLEKGYLVNDYIEVPEVKEIKEQGHYETIAEYPNGGKDIKWVVDVPGVEYKPATREEIRVYMPYTQKELAKIAINRKIEELIRNLKETDYQAIKYAEGELTEIEYEPMKIQRKKWREEIRSLEKEIE